MADDARGEPDLQRAHLLARQVLAAIETPTAARMPLERQIHCRVALASIARGRSLLLGVLDLDRAGRADIVGVLTRSLLEVWYFGVLALLGEQRDLDRLEQDHRYWKNDLAQTLSGVGQEPGPTRRFSVYQRAKRVDELLLSIGQPAGAVDYYRQLYAAESLTTAHASIQSMMPYAVLLEDGTIGIQHDPAEEPRLRYGRIMISAVLLATLAKWTWERTDIDSGPLDAIEFDD